MPLRRSLLPLALVVAAALPAATPVSADVLVMRDGSRVETKGPWEVRGAVVVFTLKNGTLGSVRAGDADLDASQAATAEAAKPAPTPAPPVPRKPVVTLTDADVKHVDYQPPPTPATGEAAADTAGAATEAPGSQAQAPAGAAPAATAAPPPAPPERLKITNWHQDLEASTQGATLVGQITNTSADFVQDVVVTAKLFDEEGKLIADANALLGARALQPGQGTNFRVTFPGVFNYANAKFDLKGFAFKSAPDA